MKFIITESQKNELVKKYLKEQDDSSKSGLTLGDIGRQALEYAKNLIRNKNNDTSSTSNDDSTHTTSTSSSNLDLSKISDTGKQLLENPIFKEKLKEISDSIHIDENSIIKLMKHESGLNPSIKNSIGCVGLIQFCPDSGGGATKTVKNTH